MGLFGNSGQIKVSPELSQINTSAQNLYNQGAGFGTQPLQQLIRPYSPQTQGALSGIYNTAQGGNPLAGQSVNDLNAIMNSSGGMSQRYRDLFNNSGNQAYAAAINNQSAQLGNQIQSQFGALGRTGSAADTGALATQLGNFRSNAEAQNWNQNVSNQMGILNAWQGARQNAVQQAPGVYAQQYLPYQMQAQVGAATDALDASNRQALATQWGQQNAAPWGRLAAYTDILGANTGAAQRAGLIQPPSNPLGGLLGGALSGAQLGGMFGSPGLGAGIGGGLGLAGGLNLL